MVEFNTSVLPPEAELPIRSVVNACAEKAVAELVTELPLKHLAVFADL